jgi:hypothetical protein
MKFQGFVVNKQTLQVRHSFDAIQFKDFNQALLRAKDELLLVPGYFAEVIGINKNGTTAFKSRVDYTSFN